MAVSMATCRCLHFTRNQTDPGTPSLCQLGPKSGALCLLLCSFRPQAQASTTQQLHSSQKQGARLAEQEW